MDVLDVLDVLDVSDVSDVPDVPDEAVQLNGAGFFEAGKGKTPKHGTLRFRI